MTRMALGMSSVLQAHRRIAPFIRRTPLVRSAYLSDRTGGDIWLKLECRQVTGSFKARGALNKMGLLTPDARVHGVVTGSAGNHGLGVAYAAQAMGGASTPAPESACVFVPTNAPRIKVDKLRGFGTAVHQVGCTYEEAHIAAEAYAQDTGATYVSAYDDIDVIAGQGTMGLEIMLDLPEVDAILVPVGGGGMIAGIAVVVEGMNRRCQVVGVQPEASPAALLSLRDGVPYDPYDHEPTIADGLAGGFGTIPFSIARTLIDRILLASEEDMCQAIFVLLDREHLVVEASGAIAIAPLLNGTFDVVGQIVVCVLSGANIETALLRHVLVKFA